MTIINLFPRDNRSAELASAAALILFAIHIVFAGSLPERLADLQEATFWVLAFSVLGFIQLVSLLAYPHTEILRAGMSWLNGLLWIWLSLSAYTAAAPAIMLGVTNLYAFVVNVNLLRTTWKD